MDCVHLCTLILDKKQLISRETQKQFQPANQSRTDPSKSILTKNDIDLRETFPILTNCGDPLVERVSFSDNRYDFTLHRSKGDFTFLSTVHICQSKTSLSRYHVVDEKREQRRILQTRKKGGKSHYLSRESLTQGQLPLFHHIGSRIVEFLSRFVSDVSHS